MNERKLKLRREWLKAFFIIELIVCYVAFLNIVSHARGPQNYKVVTDRPILTISDFVTFRGDQAQGDSLYITNQTQGSPAGYMAQIHLDELERIYIDFNVNCPANLAGSGLCVDLYNEDSGYDYPEQEHQIFFQEGINEVSLVLNTGETAPKEALLRFFTGDITEYEIENLQICREVPVAKVSSAMIGALIGNLIILAVVAFFYVKCSKQR